MNQHRATSAPADEVPVDDFLQFGNLKSAGDPRAIRAMQAYAEHNDKSRFYADIKVVVQQYRTHGPMASQSVLTATPAQEAHKVTPSQAATAGIAGAANKPYPIQVQESGESQLRRMLNVSSNKSDNRPLVSDQFNSMPGPGPGPSTPGRNVGVVGGGTPLNRLQQQQQPQAQQALARSPKGILPPGLSAPPGLAPPTPVDARGASGPEGSAMGQGQGKSLLNRDLEDMPPPELLAQPPLNARQSAMPPRSLHEEQQYMQQQNQQPYMQQQNQQQYMQQQTQQQQYMQQQNQQQQYMQQQTQQQQYMQQQTQQQYMQQQQQQQQYMYLQRDQMQMMRLQQQQQQQPVPMAQQLSSLGSQQPVYSYALPQYTQMQPVTTASGYVGAMPTYVIQPQQGNMIQSPYPGVVVHAPPQFQSHLQMQSVGAFPPPSYVSYERSQEGGQSLQQQQQQRQQQQQQQVSSDDSAHDRLLAHGGYMQQATQRSDSPAPLNADATHFRQQGQGQGQGPSSMQQQQQQQPLQSMQWSSQSVDRLLHSPFSQTQGQGQGQGQGHSLERQPSGALRSGASGEQVLTQQQQHEQQSQSLRGASAYARGPQNGELRMPQLMPAPGQPIRAAQPVQGAPALMQQQQQQQQLFVQQQQEQHDQTAQRGGRPAALYRITRNQRGSISMLYQTRKDGHETRLDVDGAPLKPGTYMEVEWVLPVEEFMGPQARGADLVVGLVRYGAGTNSPGIVTKPLGRLGKHTVKGRDLFGNEIVTGRLQFHAPKSAGAFVYRLFDNQSKERSLCTLATSLAFVIELGDTDITVNLGHSLSSFLDSAYSRALTQFNCTVKGMRGPGKPVGKDHPQVLLQKCMWAIFDVLEEGVAILDKAREREKERDREKQEGKQQADKDKSSDGSGAASKAESASPGMSVPDGSSENVLAKIAREQREQLEARTKGREDEEFWSNAKSAARLQTDIRDAVVSVSSNRIAWAMLTDAQRTYVNSVLSKYCRVTHRHFQSVESMQAEWVDIFGFLPAQIFSAPLDAAGDATSEGSSRTSPAHHFVSKKVLTALDRKIAALLPSLLPSEDFHAVRDAARRRIEEAVRNGSATRNLPPETAVHLYGSSRNNFGSNSADLDMCLMLPPSFEIPADEKPVIIELVGEALQQAGMQVQPRPTARIPIVQFIEPASGFECDLSFNNPLAMRNTDLLRAYSEVDPRVRPLAFTIKNWAKSRHMNTPGDGTLSSYGYILLLVHYLQTRQPPVVPNLQRLPPDWEGGHVDPATADLAAELGFDIELSQDGTPCKTYFFVPSTEKSTKALRTYGSKNKSSIGELLVGFFEYYAFDFDFRGSVVSIQAGQAITKVGKAEVDGWPLHERLSIEDPFERSYDVGHVIKGAQMMHIQKELLRAFTLLQRTNESETTVRVDELPGIVKADQLLELIMEPCSELPKFVRETRELRERQEKIRREKIEQEKVDRLEQQLRRDRFDMYGQ